jgi:branched-chain amino acid transport system permease protein
MVFMLLGLGLNIVVGSRGCSTWGTSRSSGSAYATALLTGATLNTTTGSTAPAFSMHLNFRGDPDHHAAGRGRQVLIGAPVLRLRGDYLAIVTLGLGEMVSI